MSTLPATAAIIGAGLTGLMLAMRNVRTSPGWRATVTPLASIIGSGFLIIAPMLHALTGRWSLLAIAGLSALAYAIGSVMRFNVAVAEPRLQARHDTMLNRVDRVSQLVLGATYAVSVAFYTSLFVAFLAQRVPALELSQAAVTSVVLIAITAVAWRRGTRGLESIEVTAVTVKLAIIAGVLAGLALYDAQRAMPWFEHAPIADFSAWDTAAALAGMLMVAQGFETTRFTGHLYPRQVRVRAARRAQLVAAGIYVLFVGLTCPLYLEFPIAVLTETTVSETLGHVALVFPSMLFVAAAASQLSAALADTIGGAGLITEAAPVPLGDTAGCMLMVTTALAIVWTTDVFGIINVASKGFALYYLLQVLVTVRVLLGDPHRARRRRVAGLAGCGLLAAALLFVVVFSRAAPHA